MLTAQKMQALCLAAQHVWHGHHKVPDLHAQVTPGIAQGQNCKAASLTAATAWPPPLGMPHHTGYPGYNSVFALLKKKHEQYEATEKLWWFSYPFLNRLHFQIPGTDDVPRLELHICKSQCVFLLFSLHFLGAPAARENFQLCWLQCRPATGRSNRLQRTKIFED